MVNDVDDLQIDERVIGFRRGIRKNADEDDEQRDEAGSSEGGLPPAQRMCGGQAASVYVASNGLANRCPAV
jgi:hypothetical protein